MKHVRLFVLFVALVGCNGDGPDREVGAACQDDFDCRDRCLDNWPGGFCTVRCSDNRDCPVDTVCIDSQGGVCMLRCHDSAECKDYLGDKDYKCNDRRDVHDDKYDVCVPD